MCNLLTVSADVFVYLLSLYLWFDKDHRSIGMTSGEAKEDLFDNKHTNEHLVRASSAAAEYEPCCSINK